MPAVHGLEVELMGEIGVFALHALEVFVGHGLLAVAFGDDELVEKAGLSEEVGLPVRTAGDSQALIQLKKEYCDRKDCLRCRFGYEYLRRK